ncbi:MAG: hypothetical protein IJX39_06170 [Clostridia bacterium]|nr:hypothetical protein [Clostridia bacterium]
MVVSYSKLKKIAYLLLALPTCIFALGFLKLWIGIPLALLVGGAYFFAIRGENLRDTEGSYTLQLSMRKCLILLGVVALWCYLSGLGNLYFQTSDWGARNAIFRDLIRYDWPVIYDVPNSALVYYIGFWLPAALFGKLALVCGGGMAVSFAVGNIALLLWSILNLYVIILLILLYVRAHTTKRFAVALAVIIGFSGLDIVGVFCQWMCGVGIPYHFEWWTPYQFTSMAACLGWVFNQAIPAWLTVICFLHEKSLRSYAFLLVLCAASAPLPCVGLAIYMAAVLAVRIWHAVREKTVRLLLFEIFTPQNLVAVCVLLPMWFSYYISNMAISAEQTLQRVETDLLAIVLLLLLGVLSAVGALLLSRRNKEWYYAGAGAVLCLFLGIWALFNPDINRHYLFAFLLESGVYLAILGYTYRGELLYRAAFFCAVFCPLFSIGTDFDFCMRASIPTVFILMLLSVKFLFEHEEALTLRHDLTRELRVGRVLCVVLIVALLIGSVTAMRDFGNGFWAVGTAGKLNVVNDKIYTFNQIFTGEREGAARNFTSVTYQSTFFFRFLAK